MGTQLKTLTYPNTPSGQSRKVTELQAYLSNGWEIVSENITSGSFDANSAATQACCFGLICAPICMPLAVLGKTTQGQIIVTLKRDGDDMPSETFSAPAAQASVMPQSKDLSLSRLPLQVKVELGDMLPFFSLLDQCGNTFRSDEYEADYLVLAFYFKDMSLGYAIFVKEFQKLLSEFHGHNALVIGIGEDDAQSHQAYATKHGITYPLLVDPGSVTAKQMKAHEAFPMSVLVYDKSKRAVLNYSNRWNSEEPAKQALKAISEHSAANCQN